MLYVLDGTKGKLLNILPCFGKYQINETGSFILVQKSNNSVLLFHSGDIVMTYNCDLPSETSQILEIKYENDNFLVEMGDETGILSRQEIILK